MLDRINIFTSDVFKSLINGDVNNNVFCNLVMLISSILRGDLNTHSTDSSVETTEIGTRLHVTVCVTVTTGSGSSQ